MTTSAKQCTFSLSKSVLLFLLLLLFLLGRLAPFPSDALLALPAGTSCLLGILCFFAFRTHSRLPVDPAQSSVGEQTERDELSPYISEGCENGGFSFSSSYRYGVLSFLVGSGFALFTLLIAAPYPHIFSALLTVTPSTLGLPIVWLFTILYSSCVSLAGYALASFLLSDSSIVQSRESSDSPFSPQGEKVRERGKKFPFLRSLAMLLLLCLLPTFAVTLYASLYTYMLQTFSLTQGIIGPYPALRALASLLPWQVPAHIPVNTSNLPLSLFWYIPIESGNPWIFDPQSLIPYILLGIVLVHLSSLSSGRETEGEGIFFLLRCGFSGVLLMLPALLWVLPGIQGILQVHGIVVSYPTLTLLNTWLIVLNLFTGFVTTSVVALLYRMYAGVHALLPRNACPPTPQQR